MSERFRIPVTVETDGAGSFVGGAMYHSCVGENFLQKQGEKKEKWLPNASKHSCFPANAE